VLFLKTDPVYSILFVN